MEETAESMEGFRPAVGLGSTWAVRVLESIIVGEEGGEGPAEVNTGAETFLSWAYEDGLILAKPRCSFDGCVGC
jgi:hypothetical protein